MAKITLEEQAAFQASLAELYRELLSDYGEDMTSYRRYLWRETMVYHQNKCADLMAAVKTQAVQP